MNIRYLTFILVVSICYYRGVLGGCDHPVYCNGQLLSTIQLAQVFNDSKTFVDMPMKYSSGVILDKFAQLIGNDSSQSPSGSDLMSFLEENFYPAGYEVQPVTPEDWIPHPPFLKKIHNRDLSIFAQDLHNKWLSLARVFNTSDLCENCYSSIPVQNPFIIAGSRFREYYYWDTYWIIRGLLVSEMAATVKGMLLNMQSLIQDFGFIPNGGRIYYLDRSQPPLFTQMVKLYFKHTEDVDFLREVLPTLEAEYQWWMNERSLTINGYTLNLYNATNYTPRPESFYEDYTMAQQYFPSNETAQTYFYSSIASCAESGWDFSTRWMEPNSMDLQTVQTIQIVPVDLNSILYDNEVTLSEFNQYLGNDTQSQYYYNQSEKRSSAIMNLLWNEEKLQWFDLNLRTGLQSNQNFYTSNIMPLFAGLQKSEAASLNDSVIEEIIKNLYSVYMDYPGGVPTSLINSTQQWDFPNAWAPLQYFMISILESTDLNVTQGMLQTLINRWISTNYCGWYETLDQGGIMFEKYDALNLGIPGSGGEYVVQVGFGWTNGVALYLLEKFNDQIILLSC